MDDIVTRLQKAKAECQLSPCDCQCPLHQDSIDEIERLRADLATHVKWEALLVDVTDEVDRLRKEVEDCNNDFHALKEMFDKTRDNRNRWREAARELFRWLELSGEDDEVHKAGLEALAMYDEATRGE